MEFADWPEKKIGVQISLITPAGPCKIKLANAIFQWDPYVREINSLLLLQSTTRTAPYCIATTAVAASRHIAWPTHLLHPRCSGASPNPPAMPKPSPARGLCCSGDADGHCSHNGLCRGSQTQWSRPACAPCRRVTRRSCEAVAAGPETTMSLARVARWGRGWSSPERAAAELVLRPLWRHGGALARRGRPLPPMHAHTIVSVCLHHRH